MADRPVPPRIPPLPPAERSPDVADLLARTLTGPDGEPLNIFATLARHPDVLHRWLPFGTALLLKGLLPARDRELVILRTGWNCRSDYEWGQHVAIGRGVGLDDADFERVVAGPDAPGWAPHEAAVLQAADELHATATISDATWAALAAHYGERELIELPMLVGQYHLVAFVLNALRVRREPGVAGLPEQAGA